MNTVVQFLGLFIVMSLNSGGLHVILPRVTVAPPHPSFIAYRRQDLVAQSGFPARGTFNYDGDTYEWVAVAREVFEFNGATDPAAGSASDLPHLTCCCTPMQSGLKRAYADPTVPALQRRSAHFMVRNGTASITTDPHGALVTQVSMTSAAGVTLSAGPRRSLTFRPGARILIGHEPLPGSSVTRDHFHAYYQTGRNPASLACTSTPIDDPTTCGPRPTACDIAQPSVQATRRRRTPVPEDVDLNCSNTHWP